MIQSTETQISNSSIVLPQYTQYTGEMFTAVTDALALHFTAALVQLVHLSVCGAVGNHWELFLLEFMNAQHVWPLAMVTSQSQYYVD
jgi:hypothetical protein